MSRILITGGSGSLGRQLSPRLQAAGYTVRILSRSLRPDSMPEELEWAQGNIGSGEGLAAAMEDVDIVVHAASNAAGAKIMDTGGARNILALAKQQPIDHFFYISIVGIEDVPFAYYQAKLATEHVVEQGSSPWTILRATQFHSFLGDAVLPLLNRLPLLFVPTDIPFQLIDEDEVAGRMVELIQQGPSGRAEDIGGPEIILLGQITDEWLRMQEKQRRIFHLPLLGKVAAAYRAGNHTTPDHRYGQITWQQWLQRRFNSTWKD